MIVSRRGLCHAAISVAATVLAVVLGKKALTAKRYSNEQESLVVTDAGGSSEDAAARSYYDPFEKETGININYSARPNMALGQLKAMVMAEHVAWDVTILTDYFALMAAANGLLERIDYSQMDGRPMSKMLPGALSPFMVGTDVFATVFSYSTEKWPAGKGPKTWGDFWDVDRFPGRRSMSGTGYGPLEFALLADGVPQDRIYPLDVSRALRKMDEIRPYVTVWTTTAAQQHQLVVDREVDLIQGFANRLQSAIDSAAPFFIEWNQGNYNLEGWVIPKGARHLKTALRFIEFTLRPDLQAINSMQAAHGPANLDAFSRIPKSRAQILPTYPENLKKMFPVDASWVAEHVDELLTRWADWIAKDPS